MALIFFLAGSLLKLLAIPEQVEHGVALAQLKQAGC